MKKTLEIMGKTMKVIFIVFCVFMLSLFFWSPRLPQSVVESLCARCSAGSRVVSCEAMSFGFRDGLRLEEVRVYDKSRKNPLDPVASVGAASFHFFQKKIVLEKLSYARLPDGYYGPVPFSPPTPDEGPSLADIGLPRFEGLTLELEHASVLGVEPRHLVSRVRCDGKRIDFSDIRLTWPSEENDMALDGMCAVDFGTMRVDGYVRGTATQPLIRPLLVALDIPASLPYIDAFTGVVGPVKSYCSWGVDLRTCQFKIDLDLTPRMGRYNGVPLRTATGKLSFGVSFPKGRMDFSHVIGPIHATDRSKGRLDGSIFIVQTNSVLSLNFDAASTLAKDDLLDIIDYLNGGSLDELKCATPPSVTAKGLLFPYDQTKNDLSGTIAFEKGSLFGIPLKDARTRYAYVGDTVRFTDVSATAKRGGKIAGKATLVLPLDRPDDRSFDLDIAYRGGRVEELADILPMDLGDRRGIVDAKVRLAAPLGTNVLAHLNGRGTVSVRDGHIAQMKLFSGWTKMVSEYVPGIASIVNQSRGHGSFTIRDGVLTTHDAVIDGSALLAIYFDGSYDMVHDRLDAKVQVRLLKDDSILGKFLIRPVLWPFAKLLLDFHLTGKIDDPEWTAIPLLKGE